MNWRDHAPPHFHVTCGGQEAIIHIRNGVVLAGSLPHDSLRQVIAWCKIHQEELLENWERATRKEPLNRIPPL